MISCNRVRIPSTLGNIRVWQYDLAVSCMAISSSVNREAASSGSSQFRVTGACAYRVHEIEVNLEAGTRTFFRDMSLIMLNTKQLGLKGEMQGKYSLVYRGNALW